MNATGTGAQETAPGSARLRELRVWQSARLACTYGDFLRDPLSADAVGFYLTDLQGPDEHPRRDDDLTRAWSRLRRTLPETAFEALVRARELQQLTAELDLAMLERLEPGPLTWTAYAQAYRAVGRAEARARQIELVLGIGADLGHIVRHEWLALALRAARPAARLAGFAALQDFLERGFNSFRKMPDPARLLAAIRDRETRLSAALLSGAEPPADLVGVR